MSVFYLVRYALSRLEDKDQVTRKSAAAAVLRRLDAKHAKDDDEDDETDDGRDRRSRKENLDLNQYEQMVAMDVVAPEDIPVTFEGTVSSIMKRHQLPITVGI